MSQSNYSINVRSRSDRSSVPIHFQRLILTTHLLTCTCVIVILAQNPNGERKTVTFWHIKMSTLWCMKWFMLHSSWMQHFPVWLYWIFSTAKQLLFRCLVAFRKRGGILSILSLKRIEETVDRYRDSPVSYVDETYDDWCEAHIAACVL